MSGYLGFIGLSETLAGVILTRDGDTPKDGASAPTFRVYGSSGLMANGTGSGSFKDSGTVTGATNASPIVITSTAHGLTTGTRVTVAGVGGNTAANGDFTITKIDANTFSLDGSTGNGAYTSGGTWHVSGLYGFTLSVTGANGYEAGKTYSLVWTATVASVVRSDVLTFTVV